MPDPEYKHLVIGGNDEFASHFDMLFVLKIIVDSSEN